MTVEFAKVLDGSGDYFAICKRRKWWMFGPVIEEFARGRFTVWHYWPSGDRCGTSTERWLSNRFTAWKWQNEKA